MHEQEAADFNAFLREMQTESDRGAALVGSALVDHYLCATLRAFMIAGKQSDGLLDDPYAPFSSLSARIKGAYALGLITEYERHECETIRAVRNKFAHEKHGLTFADPKIKVLCLRLRSPLPGGRDEFTDKPRAIFNIASALVVANLRVRSLWVEKSRRTVLPDDAFPNLVRAAQP